MYLAAFNGQWQPTPDSALYRSLGESLAEGRGYTYLGVAHDHAYPGLPMLLAAMRRWLGGDLGPALVGNLLLVGAGLTLVYRTLRQDHPRWRSAAVVLIVGLNAQLLEHSARVLTEVPFFFAVCVVWYAQRKLAAGRRRWGGVVVWLGVLGAGVWLAAMLRPAFYVLLAALALAAVFDAARGSWRRSVGVGGLLAGVGALWWWLDVREGGHDEMKIRRLLEQPEAMADRLGEYLPRLLTEHGMDAFFGLQIAPGLDTLLTLGLLAGALTLGRPRRVGSGSAGWRSGAVFGVALVGVMLGVTLLFSGTLPRYYVAVLPVLALGWVQGVRRVGHLLPRPMRGWVVAGLVVLPMITNGVEAGRLVVRQHAGSTLDTFEHGYWRTYHELAEAIHREVPAGQRVIGPQPRVLTFWSGRDTLSAQQVAGLRRSHGIWRSLREAGVSYVVLPVERYKHTPARLQRVLEAVSPLVETVEDEQGWRLIRLEMPTAGGVTARVVARGGGAPASR